MYDLFSELKNAVEALLEDVVSRHPEIVETQSFQCPYMQELSEIINFRRWHSRGGCGG